MRHLAPAAIAVLLATASVAGAQPQSDKEILAQKLAQERALSIRSPQAPGADQVARQFRFPPVAPDGPGQMRATHWISNLLPVQFSVRRDSSTRGTSWQTDHPTNTQSVTIETTRRSFVAINPGERAISVMISCRDSGGATVFEQALDIAGFGAATISPAAAGAAIPTTTDAVAAPAIWCDLNAPANFYAYELRRVEVRTTTDQDDARQNGPLSTAGYRLHTEDVVRRDEPVGLYRLD